MIEVSHYELYKEYEAQASGDSLMERASTEYFCKKNYDILTIEARSIQRMQTLWPLTFSCDLDLKSRSKRFMSLDVAYIIVPWFQV